MGHEQWSVPHVAAMLHVSPQEVTAAIESGRLQASTSGSEWVITREQLNEFTREGNPFSLVPAQRTDEDLMRAAQDGDDTAFEVLEKRYRRPLWGLCSRRLKNPNDADDATQMTLVAAWAKRATYRLGLPVKPWLMKIARNACRDLNRAGRRRDGLIMLEPEPAESIADTAPIPEQETERRHLAEAIDDCLSELETCGPNYREAIILRYIEELKLREMEEPLGVHAEGSVNYTVKKALEALRRCMADKGYEIV